MFKQEFLNLGTTDMLDWKILCCGGGHVHSRILSSIPGLHPLDKGSIPQLRSTHPLGEVRISPDGDLRGGSRL